MIRGRSLGANSRALDKLFGSVYTQRIGELYDSMTKLTTPCLCIHLRRAAQRVSTLYDNALSPAGIGVAQYFLLVSLAEMEGCGTGELARAVGLERSTLVRNLKLLEQAGFIEDRSSVESCARQFYLTDKGRAVLERALPLWQEAQEGIKKILGEKNTHDLVTLLTILENL